MQCHESSDILVGTAPFNGDRYDTAYAPAEVQKKEKIGNVILLDSVKNKQ